MFLNRALACLAFLSCCQLVVSTEYVPVFMWGDLERASLKSNPLRKISSQEFNEILQEQVGNEPFIVTFIEETLSVEDFSKKTDGETSFPFLESKLGTSLYLSAVSSALDQVNSLAGPDNADKVKLTENGLSAQLEPTPGRYLFISLQDAKKNEARSDMLKRHNDFMQEMYGRLLEKYDKVVAIYTARHPSWSVPEELSRVRREVTQATPVTAPSQPVAAPSQPAAARLTARANPMVLNYTNLLFYVNDSVTLQKNGDQPQVLARDKVVSSNNASDIWIALTFDSNIVMLVFEEVSGYWFLNSVVVSELDGSNEIHLNGSSIYALKNFSYHCSNKASYSGVGNNNTYTFTLSDFQMQPFYDGALSQFGDAFDCVHFTSVPIWSGLFVVAIMLLITFYGIMMMMDIRTMDRFDDPKGKTININASE